MSSDTTVHYLGKRTAFQKVEAKHLFFNMKVTHEDSPENPPVVYNNMKIKMLSGAFKSWIAECYLLE